MSKKLLLSLAVAGVIIPFFSNNAIAYPGYQHNNGAASPQCNAPCCANKPTEMMKKPDPEFLEAVRPIRAANRALFNALEEGDIKKIQAAAKKFSQEMTQVKHEEVKKHLTRSAHIANVMSTTTSYRELLAGYNIIKHETSMYHPNQGQYSGHFPRLKVDTSTYTTISEIDKQVKSLILLLRTDSEKDINTKIDEISRSLKNVKVAQLQEFVTPLQSSLNEMKKAKTILGKVLYKRIVMARARMLADTVQQKA